MNYLKNKIMKAEEKAEDLVNKYYLELKEHSNNYDEHTAKQCALIAIDELIKVACDYSDYDETVTKEYWEKVKIEIEKL